VSGIQIRMKKKEPGALAQNPVSEAAL